MNKTKGLTSIISAALLCACQSTSLEESREIVALEYYPDCDYQVLGMVSSVDGKTNHEFHFNERKLFTRSALGLRAVGDKTKAFDKLKAEAKSLGADAVAVTSFKHISGEVQVGKGKSVETAKYYYRGEAIKLCDGLDLANLNKSNGKPVRFNSSGQLNTGVTFKNKIKIDLSSVNTKKTFVHHFLHENEVITDNGNIFGVNIGESMDVLITELGDPSVIINIAKDKTAFMYGRKHLFYLINDHITAYKFGDFILPPHLNNEINLHAAFDNFNPTLENGVNIGDKLRVVQEKLAIPADKNSAVSEVIVKRNDYYQHYEFIELKDLANDFTDLKLNNVSIYKKPLDFNWSALANNRNIAQVISIDSGISGISLGADKIEIMDVLGTPDLVINRSSRKTSWIYGNNLLFNFTRDTVVSYKMLGAKITQKQLNCNDCLYLGQPLSALSKHTIEKNERGYYGFGANGLQYLLLSHNDSDKGFVDEIEVVVQD